MGNRLIPISEPRITPQDVDNVVEAMVAQHVSGRSGIVSTFENKFLQTLGYKDRCAYATSSGTSALELALKTSGIEDGDRVILPALTYSACVNAVLSVGGEPIFVDLDDNSFCIDLGKAIDISKDIGVENIMIVHLYGEVMDINWDSLWFYRTIIEDCAESLGCVTPESLYELEPVHCGGNDTSISVFSFYANKLITTGEGGMMTIPQSVHDSLPKNFIRAIMNNGSPGRGDYGSITRRGSNYRMSALQAALGCSQLDRFEDIVFARRGVMDYYNKYLGEFYTTCDIADNPWLFGIHIPEGRDEFVQHCKSLGVQCRLPFPVLPELECYKPLYPDEYPNARAVYDEWVFLPSSPYIKVSDQERVIEAVLKF